MKKETKTDNRVFSDTNYAETYARQHKKMGENLARDYIQKLTGHGFRQGKILDVGSGSGAMDIYLAREFPDSEIVGIDLSEPLLQLANQEAQMATLGERVRFEKADVQDIPFEENSFAVAINTNMVHLVEDPIQMLNEIERVLKPDGFLFIADLRRSWLGLFEREMRYSLTVAEAKELFRQSKLREGVFSSSLIWWRFEAPG